MPPTLHPYLKRGLDFDASPADPSDRVGDTAAESHDAEQSAAKRRRVEAIALQYLRGKPPLILTARLKGPFTKEWRNPWMQAANTRPDGQSKGVTGRAEGRGKRKSQASHVASPETSRAAADTEELYSQPDLEPLPATASLPDGDNTSGSTEFFSVETEQFITKNSPANPFWLRRPATSITFPPNSQTDKSPIRPRSQDRRFIPQTSLQLMPPKRPLPIRATPPDEWQSSTSVSTNISPPPEPATVVKQAPERGLSQTMSLADLSGSSRMRADSAQEDEARSSQAAQYAQPPIAAETPARLPNECNAVSSDALAALPVHAQSFDSLVPATTYKVSSTVQVPQSSPTRGPAGVGGQASLLRADLQRCAGQLPRLKPTSAKKQHPSPVNREPVKDNGLPKRLRHNLVASPAPASSTGFVYRKVGQPKGENDNISMTKPRAVNFSSSPILSARTDRGQLTADPRVQISVAEPVLSECVVPHTPVEAAGGSSGKENSNGVVRGAEQEQNKDEQQESFKSKQSQCSTQAAMLLAHLEFQENSSQSSTSSAALRPWSQPAQNTPPPLLPQPSPAITPLSVFNARTDISFSDLAGDDVLHDPPISTQDLFEAASPFAFSTVKKRSQGAHRTSLRFALTSRLGASMTAKSPAPCADHPRC